MRNKLTNLGGWSRLYVFVSVLWFMFAGAEIYQNFPELTDFTDEEQRFLGTTNHEAKRDLFELADIDLEPEDDIDKWFLREFFGIDDLDHLDPQTVVVFRVASKLEKYVDVTDGSELPLTHYVYLSTIPALQDGLAFEELVIESPASKDDLVAQAKLFGPPILSDKKIDEIVARLQNTEASTNGNYRWRVQYQKDKLLKYGMQSSAVLFLPPIALLLLFLSIRWVYRGFRSANDE